MNILILSCGTRDKVVKYFKAAFGEEGKVVTTDCSPYAPALYEGDAHYIVPRITEPGYIDVILDICKKFLYFEHRIYCVRNLISI